ncbi:MAG: LacI family DNA-binding transcriptional regulator [Calditrichaeota bacterium]|nr:LacI family DNA-binding transcriptional regulator [Calditrichota bacterium]HQU70697.1 LacI family DNA-binding transcriptional regulator [Calditrichia bacterium]
MKVDIREIARRAGVSTATVSRTLSGKGPVREETRRKVMNVVQDLNYRPNSRARNLSRRQTDTIGVILPELVDEFFMDLIHSIDEEAYLAGHYVMISSSHNQRNIVQTLVEFMDSGRVDGVILMAPKMMDSRLSQRLKQIRGPIVFLNSRPEIENCISFTIDNYQGATSMVRHLISHGYERIAMIKGPEGNSDADERYQGYLDCMLDHGLRIDPSLVVEGDFTIKGGYHGFMRLFGLPKPPRAIFAANDMMALGAYEAAKQTGINIPDDVALGGFDDIFLSKLLNPRLTTVHAPIVELGSKALRYLLQMISGEVESNGDYHEKLSTGLVIGGSCGCESNHSPLIP